MYTTSELLEILPLIGGVAIGAILLASLIRALSEQLDLTAFGIGKSRSDPADTVFVPPPGDGYRYFAPNHVVVYIRQMNPGCFRIYAVSGARFSRRDRYGSFKQVSCRDSLAVEKLIDQMFSRSQVWQ